MSFTVDGSSAPLFFKYRELVAGRGFVAGVTVTGRVLCVQEQAAEFWMYGVQPGGLADWGETPEAAHLAFRRAFHAVLIDIASDAPDAETFEASVRAFVTTPNEPTEAMWRNAVDAVKRGVVDAHGLERWPSSTPVDVEVVILREPSPALNVLEDRLQHAIAA